MKFIDEYRDTTLARKLVDQIARLVTRPWVLMEACGGHAHSVVKYGIERLLPLGVELMHGPGCPVSVTPVELIDQAHTIARERGVIFCAFADTLCVAGSQTTLLELKSRGADVRVVSSPMDCLKIARTHPERQVVFFALGFETAAPANAMAAWQAQRQNLTNFSMLVSHVRLPPLLGALLQSTRNRVQACLGPGHVCAVMGYREYEPLCREFALPVVVTGFEPVDLLQGTLMAVRQLEEGRAEVENQYPRVVQRYGNPVAVNLVRSVFEICDRPWRSFGLVPNSGYQLRPEFQAHDAEHRFFGQTVNRDEPVVVLDAERLRAARPPQTSAAFPAPIGAPVSSPSPLRAPDQGADSILASEGRPRPRSRRSVAGAGAAAMATASSA